LEGIGLIFSVEGHIKQIVDGVKTQTRRNSNRYQVGKSYKVQPCRGCEGIHEGVIHIIGKWSEDSPYTISEGDAESEGEYTPEEYEQVYSKLYPGWKRRYVYVFKFMVTDPPKCFGYVNSTSKDDPNPVRDCSECLLLQPCIAEYDERVYDNPYDPSFFDGELSDEERGGVF
jgi:hypothetical protein